MSYGSGQIGVAQLVSYSFSGIKNGSPVPPWTTGSSPVLDGQFPGYGATFPAGTVSELYPDSPFYNLGTSTCTSVTITNSFTDYFMYQPTATASRPSIWVTDAIQNWNWSGTANNKNGWTLAIKPAPVSPGSVTATPSTALPSWNAVSQPQLPC